MFGNRLNANSHLRHIELRQQNDVEGELPSRPRMERPGPLGGGNKGVLLTTTP